MPIAKAIQIRAVQANPTVGDIDGNLKLVREAREAARGKADLLVFSECFATGYPLQDLALRPGFVAAFQHRLHRFATEIAGDGGPAVLIGGVVSGAERPYNAAFLVETDGTMRTTLKHRLPNEEVYDEVRIFAPGPAPRPMEFRGHKLGVLICEDFWHQEVPRALVEEGAEAIVVLNGSHFRVGKQGVRLELGRKTVRALGVPVLYVNQVCGQDELVFDGGSFALDRRGHLIAQCAFKPWTLDLSLRVSHEGSDFSATERQGQDYPDDLTAIYQAMMLGLRDYVNKSGFPGIVLGLSGGLDSAVSAAVAVDALGPDRVLAVRMPSPFTSKASMDDAADAVRLLGCRMSDAPIGEAVSSLGAALTGALDGAPTGVTHENLQARARGVILMALSNALGLMVLTTGNKSEMSVGYATLYGDMNGGFSVLKDVYKTAVFKLARWRNSHFPTGALGPRGPVVPQAIIEKPPSAELAPGQTDEQSLGSYEVLDAVLVQLVENMLGPERAAEVASDEVGERIEADYARHIERLVHRAEYKRRQGPPGVVITRRGYDKGWRLPIINAAGLL